jgi:transcription initiation factor IIF auxiliary subunit
MSISIKQSAEYQADDWWKWKVWIESPSQDLDRISNVTYTLHRTFPNPVRTIKDRESKFCLETSGWGEFTIFALVEFENKELQKLTHELELRYPDGRRTTA